MSQSTTNQSVPSEPQNAFLIFRLNGSSYAIPVEHVREIITSVEPSPIPGAPDYLEGVVNLRGRILPIVDLRKRFDLPSDLEIARECYIILTLELQDELIELGIKVDGVSEVAHIGASQVDPADDMHDYHQSLIFEGVAKTDSGIKLILDSRVLVQQLKEDVKNQCYVKGQSYPGVATSQANQDSTEFQNV